MSLATDPQRFPPGRCRTRPPQGVHPVPAGKLCRVEERPRARPWRRERRRSSVRTCHGIHGTSHYHSWVYSGRTSASNHEAMMLFLRCANGGEEAWREFDRDYGPLLTFLVRRALARRGEQRAQALEDCLSEVRATLLRNGGAKLRDYDPRFRPATWLVLVAGTTVRDWVRRETRFHGEPADDAYLERLRSPGEEPHAPATRADELEALRTALRTLPGREQLLLRLSFEDGLTNRRIAEVLGISAPTAGRLLQGALGKLRACLCERKVDGA